LTPDEMARIVVIRYRERSEMRMAEAKISPKYQVVIPKAIREQLELKPGQTVQVIAHGDRIEMVPVRSLSEMRGFLAGIDTTVERESDRE
jgi:AbrB family looped-hinge helix DNA binding protein